MREMRLGDRGFFYHSQSDKAVVGIVKVIKEAHPDSSTDDLRWECVDIKALRPFSQPVTLAMIKSDPRLAEMPLVKSPRLSVQPVAKDEWDIICEMGKTKS
jgi:predicted RNA-binding protein with PUA-like domain